MCNIAKKVCMYFSHWQVWNSIIIIYYFLSICLVAHLLVITFFYLSIASSIMWWTSLNIVSSLKRNSNTAVVVSVHACIKPLPCKKDSTQWTVACFFVKPNNTQILKYCKPSFFRERLIFAIFATMILLEYKTSRICLVHAFYTWN